MVQCNGQGLTTGICNLGIDAAFTRLLTIALSRKQSASVCHPALYTGSHLLLSCTTSLASLSYPRLLLWPAFILTIVSLIIGIRLFAVTVAPVRHVLAAM